MTVPARMMTRARHGVMEWLFSLFFLVDFAHPAMHEIRGGLRFWCRLAGIVWRFLRQIADLFPQAFRTCLAF
jgi:hypothetical protein